MQFRQSKVFHIVVGVIIGVIIGYSVSYVVASITISDLKGELEGEIRKSAELEKKLSKATVMISFLNDTKRELQNELAKVREELENKSAELIKTKMELQLVRNESEILKGKISALKEELNQTEKSLEVLKEIVANAGLNQIKLSKIFFYSTEPPEGEINPTAMYERGQDVWIFAELRGFGVKEVNQTYIAHIIWRLDVYDIYGNLIISIPIDKYEKMTERPESAWLKACFSANLSPGVYIAVLVAYDKISLKFTARAGAFLIEE